MERFWEKVNIVPGECWEWTAGIRNGYGAFKLNGKAIDAHRVSYEAYNGEIPKGKIICHTCDNPKCVNPEHLYAGTYADNVHDMIKRNRCNYNRDHLRKHPGIKAYQRGCRCEDCTALMQAKREKYSEKRKTHTWAYILANRIANRKTA